MRLKSHKNSKKGPGKLITGILVGGVVGATVGWLMAPTSGAETRRRLRGGAMRPRDARERDKTAEGNVENRARELVEEVSKQGTAR
jgi:gas vesicle protein